MKIALAAAALFGVVTQAGAAELPIPILAAENFYGEVAEAIGGDRVKVENLLLNPDTDPHDFEPPASVARAVADAAVVIMNGADYDHWMEKLVEASASEDRTVIDVASLIGVKEGDNPHIWYNPAAVPALVDALAKDLVRIDPEGAAGYESRRAAYLETLAPLTAKIAAIKGRFAGAPVTATEPVFGPMAAALGLDMCNQAFQTAIMNEAEPAATDIAAIEDDLRNRRVKVLFYNEQVTDPLTERLLAAAKEGDVPVVGVTETLPEGSTYASWMIDQLNATEKALASPSS
jgi:zinc/manganese transport system substrate-binding protein